MLSPTIEYKGNEYAEYYRTLSIGKRLVIVGEAQDGPYYEPTIIYNIRLAETIFKSGPLVDRFRDVVHVDDSIDIVFVRMKDKDFQSVYRCLESYSFDLVYIDDFNFGNSEEEIENFIEFAQDKENLGDLIHGFFNLSIYKDIFEIDKLIESYSFEDMIDTYEKGKYFSVVSDQISQHNSAAIYAAHVASIDPGVSPVNKRLDVALYKEWSKEELLYLHQSGIVAFRNSFQNGVICANSTCAVKTPGSPHRNIANFRIAQYLIQELSNALQDRIGLIQNTMQIERVHEIVENKLIDYRDLNRIRDGSYAVIPDDTAGRIYINILIVPIFSTESIRAYSQVRIFR